MTEPAWGKYDGDNGTHHHLAHHSMDVSAVFKRMLELPVIRERAELSMGSQIDEKTSARLGALVFLHDIGKLHPGFQGKGWPKAQRSHTKRGHVAESIAIVHSAFGDEAHPLFTLFQDLKTWGSAVVPLLVASFSHHGKPLTVQTGMFRSDWDSRTPSVYDWRLEATIMADAMRRWFPSAFEEGEAIPDVNRFVHFFAGMAALADWIGSYREFFAFKNELDWEYKETADRQAAQVLKEIGLDVQSLVIHSSPSFRSVSGFTNVNTGQAMIGKTSLDEHLVILEAETGSGKTEAALWRFAQLMSAGKISGLYFAVPTRAAARQLHRRVNNAMKRIFGDHAPGAVLAIPGMLAAGEAVGKALPNWKVLWEDHSGTIPARWSAEHATRFLTATVAVGTVDQALLAGLMVKHSHLRGSALARSLLVVDEVHASDAYMTSVLTNLVHSHVATGGYALLMSATLGSHARARWTGESLPSYDAAVSVGYPAVWTRRGSMARRSRGLRSKQVEICLKGMEPHEAAQVSLQAANCGARVLVIRNTVQRAVETWSEVIQIGGTERLLQVQGRPTLHHGRFAAEDRESLDRAVEHVLGVHQDRDAGGAIVIGTQTLEQSLDIDADLLVSDLCPIDVLLQRIGRLHRHELPRPNGFAKTRCVVLVPERGLDRLAQLRPNFDNGLGAWSDGGDLRGIYRDVSVLELTWRMLKGNPVWELPEMNRELVEGAMHPERIASLLREKGGEWEQYHLNHGGVDAADEALARLQRLNRDESYVEQIFPRDDERIVTRLGEEGVVLNLETSPIGPFGHGVTRLALPAHWSIGLTADEVEALEIEQKSGGFEVEVGSQSFLYDHLGLQKKIEEPTN